MGVSPILYAALRHDMIAADSPLQRAELIRDLLAAAQFTVRATSGKAGDEAGQQLLDRLVALADEHLEAITAASRRGR